jgi:hypothetical protein
MAIEPVPVQPAPVPIASGQGRPAPRGPVPSGPVRFARYAFGPNRLGYCGPDASRELFQQATSGGDDRTLRQLAHDFEGAWPYLQLIAGANGIADPLDHRVVDAYWLGNDLLTGVTPAQLGRSLEARFRPRLRNASWRWLAAAPGAGAVPVHAFHVLDVFPKVGLLRGGELDNVLKVMDSCRIRWGRVLERDGDWLVVSTVPLDLVEGKLALGTARPERIRAWWDGASFLEAAAPGDTISIHWDWACERLSPEQLASLVGWTRRELGVANKSI